MTYIKFEQSTPTTSGGSRPAPMPCRPYRGDRLLRPPTPDGRISAAMAAAYALAVPPERTRRGHRRPCAARVLDPPDEGSYLIVSSTSTPSPPSRSSGPGRGGRPTRTAVVSTPSGITRCARTRSTAQPSATDSTVESSAASTVEAHALYPDQTQPDQTRPEEGEGWSGLGEGGSAVGRLRWRSAARRHAAVTTTGRPRRERTRTPLRTWVRGTVWLHVEERRPRTDRGAATL